VRHHRSVTYSAELVLLNKHQIYSGTPKVNCYHIMNYSYLNGRCYNEIGKFKHRQNYYNEITFRDWSVRLFQQSPLYDLTLTGSSKTRSVISLFVVVPGRDRLNLSDRVQCSEIATLG